MGGSPGPLRYRLWVGGLPKDISEDEIKREFEKYGEVVDVRLRSSARDTFAFVQFGARQAFDDALENTRGTTILGARVKIAAATQDNKARPPQDDRRNDDNRNDDRRNDDRRGNDRDFDRRGERGDDRWDDRHVDRGRDDDRGRDGWQRPAERPEQWRGERNGNGRSDYRDNERGRYDDRDDERRRYDDRYDRGPERRDRYSPPPPDRKWQPRDRSRSRGGGYPNDRAAGNLAVGAHKITVEGIPEDMSWVELKDVGRGYGRSLTFSRTYRHRDCYYGMLEYSDREDAETAMRELDHRKVQGSSQRLRCYYGPGPGGDKR